MNQRYATPVAFKQAIEQRLRNESAQTGAELERLRQRLVFDRCLARLFRVLDDRAVLKGGLVLELRLEQARATKDIDLRLTGRSDDTLESLQEAGRLDLNDYLSFEIQPDPHHPEIRIDGMVYEGLRFRAEARLAGKIYGRPFGIDVAYADALTLPPESVTGSDFLEFAGVSPGEFLIYPLEAHIAEKLHAYTLPRPRPNSRVKDLPDLALIASVRSFDSGSIRAAIESTFSHRGTHPVPAKLPDPPSHWPAPYAALAKKDRLAWKELEDVLQAVRSFLDPVLGELQAKWEPGSWSWR